MTADLLVSDVEIVRADGVERVDLEATHGVITAVVRAGSGIGTRVIDGGGREAYPGAVDPHVHFRAHPSMNVEGDDLTSVGRAAAKGGVTSVIAFVLAPPDQPGVAGVAHLLDGGPDVAVDYGFHSVLWPRPEHLAALPELHQAGIRSYKLFMAYPERGFMFTGKTALPALDAIRAVDGLALVHAEDGHTIEWIDQRERAANPQAAITDYLDCRPENLEAAAVHMAALWAATIGCRLHIVHLSTNPGIRVVRELLDGAVDLSVETCPQYLALTRADLVKAGPLGKFAPVLRSEAQDSLWSAIADGTIQFIASDHAGHCGTVKTGAAEADGIFAVPYGSPGLETLFPVIYTHGVCAGRITRHQFVELVSERAARRFGWYPRKGRLEVGSDADVVIIDPDEHPVRASTLVSRAGYTLFDDMPLRGWPAVTIRRGEVVYDAAVGELAAAGGRFMATQPAREGAA